MFTLDEARPTPPVIPRPDCGGPLIVDRYFSTDGDLLVAGGCAACDRSWLIDEGDHLVWD
jgi:hypothetical protein